MDGNALAVGNAIGTAVAAVSRACRDACLLVIVLLSVVWGGACGQPRTDIIATSTEDVGDFTTRLTLNGDTLSGSVCVANTRASDEIVRRLLQQLTNHDYVSITFDVYSVDGPVGRYVRTRSQTRREALSSNTNPCRTFDRAAEQNPSAGQSTARVDVSHTTACEALPWMRSRS